MQRKQACSWEAPIRVEREAPLVTSPSEFQHTLAKPSRWVEGRELQSGARTRVALLPAAEGFGIRYALGRARGEDIVLESVPIPARLETTTNRDRCLCVERDGIVIANVEHLNAALLVCRVDNAVIVLEKRSLWGRVFRRQAIPLLANSTVGFLDAILAAGFREQAAPRPVRTVRGPFQVEDSRRGDLVAVAPGDGLRVTCTAEYERLGIPQCTVTLDVEMAAFREGAAAARTLMNQYTRLPIGLVRAGAHMAYCRYGFGSGISPDTMLIMRRGSPLGPARYGGPADELVRHKIIDFLGAAAMMGPLNNCHFTVVKSSHRHDLDFFRELEPKLRPVPQPTPAGVPA